MSAAWKSNRGAPEEGTVICAAADIPDPGTLGVDVGGFPVLLVRTANMIRAFVNACPHQYLPLDHKGDRLISADATIIRCTNHSAGYRIEDGVGAEGFGLGCALDMIPVSVTAKGVVVIG